MVISYQVADCFLEVPEGCGTILTCKRHLNLTRDVLCNKERFKFMYFCCIISMQVDMMQVAVLLFQYFFSSFRTTNCKVAVLSRIHIFDNNSFKSQPLQTKLIQKLHSNVLSIFKSKRWDKSLKSMQNEHFTMVYLVLNSTSRSYFTVMCSIQREFCRGTHMDNR